jgi:hypothetical protein
MVHDNGKAGRAGAGGCSILHDFKNNSRTPVCDRCGTSNSNPENACCHTYLARNVASAWRDGLVPLFQGILSSDCNRAIRPAGQRRSEECFRQKLELAFSRERFPERLCRLGRIQPSLWPGHHSQRRSWVSKDDFKINNGSWFVPGRPRHVEKSSAAGVGS